MTERLVELIIPGVLIIGCLTLWGLGIDSEVKSIVIMAAGWTFGSQFVRRRK